MKKAFVFLLCAVLAVSAAAFPAPVKQASAAADPSRDILEYDFYEGSGYYEINYYLAVSKFTADRLSFGISGGVNTLFDSIETFFYKYEELMYDNTHSKFMRNKDLAAFDYDTNPHYIFNMYIYFQADSKMDAGEKYREYFKRGEGTPLKPDKSNLFADTYETTDVTHFYAGGLPDYPDYISNTILYGGIQRLAFLNTVMVPFLLYGNRITLKDGEEVKKIDYPGLRSLFPSYFNDSRFDSRNTIYSNSNYSLLHYHVCDTGYIKTDADIQENDMGTRWHGWEIDTSSFNREISITYVQLNVINMYLLAILAAGALIGIMCLFAIVLPKYKRGKADSSAGG